VRFGTPLRYPGGKGKLTDYFKEVLEVNGINGTYIEPYAGGAGVAINLLLDGKVSDIVINDYDPSIYSFWKTLKNYPEYLLEKIDMTEISVKEWNIQREIQQCKCTAPINTLGFSTFYLNRTNRSGVLTGGIIGGKNQTGEYKIDARYNKSILKQRIEKISEFSDSITVNGLDANNFLRYRLSNYKRKNTLIYIDPPYYDKGSCLYMNHYDDKDHKELAETLNPLKYKWILSYDNVKFITDLYKGRNKTEMVLNYSSYSSRKGQEVFYSSLGLTMPSIDGEKANFNCLT
jgi:Site-specific DNA methylase